MNILVIPSGAIPINKIEFIICDITNDKFLFSCGLDSGQTFHDEIELECPLVYDKDIETEVLDFIFNSREDIIYLDSIIKNLR